MSCCVKTVSTTSVNNSSQTTPEASLSDLMTQLNDASSSGTLGQNGDFLNSWFSKLGTNLGVDFSKNQNFDFNSIVNGATSQPTNVDLDAMLLNINNTVGDQAVTDWMKGSNAKNLDELLGGLVNGGGTSTGNTGNITITNDSNVNSLLATLVLFESVI
ncbi:MAG: hypothetical protein RLZZ210_1030 [Pseudomonadota bacterium]